MGGRVAMAYGAKFPADIACLVIEDMDIRLREEPEISSADMKDRRALAECRMFPSFEALEQSLSRWYDSDRVARWKEDGRALEMSINVGENVCLIESEQEQESSSTTSWWCGVNPLAQFLARKSIMAVVGETEWRVCGDSEKYKFPIHLLVAGKLNTSCNINSLAKMAGMVPRVQKHTFHNAEHSIHRSEFEEYMTTLDDVIVPNAVSYYEGIQIS
jgi:pimeloyl-ACP methyl ester carboxylesterase